MESFPYSSDDVHNASEIFRQAVALLAKHQIAPTPLNYRIAYECISGNNEDLNREFIALCQQEPSPMALWNLYKRFFIQDSETLESLRSELLEIIHGIQGEFHSSGQSLAQYAHQLGHFANVLIQRPPEEELSIEVDSVLNDTNELKASQEKMEASMADIIGEVETLRRELQQVREEAMTDALTGIANRRSFDRILTQLYNDRTEQEPVSLLLIDIDKFKDFNDSFGHIIGDKILRFVASTLTRCLKGKDTPARCGGEEFAVILPNTGIQGAKAVAEQIRVAINGRNLKDSKSGAEYGKISVSIGASQWHVDEEMSSLMARTDKALYAAKTLGRNRVELAQPPVLAIPQSK